MKPSCFTNDIRPGSSKGLNAAELNSTFCEIRFAEPSGRFTITRNTKFYSDETPMLCEYKHIDSNISNMGVPSWLQKSILL